MKREKDIMKVIFTESKGKGKQYVSVYFVPVTYCFPELLLPLERGFDDKWIVRAEQATNRLYQPAFSSYTFELRYAPRQTMAGRNGRTPLPYHLISIVPSGSFCPYLVLLSFLIYKGIIMEASFVKRTTRNAPHQSRGTYP